MTRRRDVGSPSGRGPTPAARSAAGRDRPGQDRRRGPGASARGGRAWPPLWPAPAIAPYRGACHTLRAVNVPMLLEMAAEGMPDRIAVGPGGHGLTYPALLDQ